MSNRVKRKFIKPKVDFSNTPKISNTHNHIQSFIQPLQRMYGTNSFKFLNKEFILRMPKDWNSANQDKLLLYNLHYFDDLNAINSNQRAVWHYDLIQRWVDENSPVIGNGWEPYPSSLRIVNWIKWFLLNSNAKQEWLDSLSIQTRFLNQNLEYHLLGNHLFSNAKALIFAGLFFKGEEADNWYQTGINIVNQELSEQILSDGGNFELSPMYHSIFLEDLLDLVNIHQAYSRNLSDNFKIKTVQMLEWLKVMCHPDGEIAFFNDSAHGVAPTSEGLLSYAKRLNIVCKDNRLSNLTHLKESGYIRLDIEDLVLISDVAKIGPDYIPGHGHADTLSFEMSLFGKRVVVNSGTSTYEANNERHKQRSTSSHSTITVDDKNSSEVWGGFRVARRAKVFNIKHITRRDNIKFSACHNGYKRLKGKVMHCREWDVTDGLIKIIDKVTGKGNHKVRSVLPLHPDVKVSNIQEASVNLKISGKRIKVNFEGNGSLQITTSKYHPEFGLSVDNQQLIYDYNGGLPCEIITRISW